MKIQWAAGATLVGYLILAWVLGSALHLDTSRFYTLFAILAVLGIGATAVFVWFWERPGAAPPEPPAPWKRTTRLMRSCARPKAAWLRQTWRRVRNWQICLSCSC